MSSSLRCSHRACLGGALRACEILLCKPQGEACQETQRGSQAELVDQSIVEKVERTIATDLPVPTLSHENRRLCLSVLRGIVGQVGSKPCATVPHTRLCIGGRDAATLAADGSSWWL